MIKAKPIKPKKCKNCKVLFTPAKPLQSVCGYLCAAEKSKTDRLKVERRELRDDRVKAKTRRTWIAETQAVVNRFVRLRDKDDGCISCDKPASWGGQWHASHFYATSIRPNLRFDAANIHKACSVCNNWLSGNLTPYRIKLILKIGLAEVERIDNAIESKKWTIEDCKEVKESYRVKIKLMGII